MLQIALKEWAVAVRAMEQGLQDVIFRKGGIQEHTGDFELSHDRFLLYPAREHQKRELLRPNYHPLLDQTLDASEGHWVEIRSIAHVKGYYLVRSLEEARPYVDRHIWTDEFIGMRLDYKPDRPLHIIELEIELLDTPLRFLETTEYAGCRSWVELDL